VSSDVDRWAAERAVELRARAEAEAVAVLRDALVAASLRERPRGRSEESAPAPSPQAQAELGRLLWVYCVTRAAEAELVGVPGVDDAGRVERIEAAGLAALVSSVPRAEFAEGPLRNNLNDLAWLERVARAHESVLEQALSESTAIVPLRLCTLYAGEDGVREMLAGERDAFAAALDHLAGRQEWGVKVTVDPELVTEAARARHQGAKAMEEETAAQGAGGAYMLQRRFDRDVRQLAHSLASELAESVHGRLETEALEAVTRPPQNRDLSGHEGEMVLNAAYLVEMDRIDELRELVAALEQEHGALGARIELTGPWPPYNFVPGGGTAGIA
jgi:Gas vesicle synthesis protein GvpL/GvpF